MNPLSAVLLRRLACLRLPALLLVALLQRAPVLRVASGAALAGVRAPAAHLLRAATAAVASLGAVHTLAGATQFVVSPSSVNATVGTAIGGVGFAVTGATSPTGSYRIANLPPGLTVPGASGGVLNASSGSITGTPTAGGTYVTSITAYQFTGASGDTYGPATVTFTIVAPTVAPAFTTQPGGATVSAGGSATFSAVASGAPAPTFQWRKNGAALAGATNASLTLINLQPADAGTYSVVATNSAGTATSANATLTVNAAPSIAAHPTGQSVTAGTSAVFSVAAGGLPAPSFQWRRDGTTLFGATGSTLVLPGVQPADAGGYTVVVSNSFGSVTSNSATLTVNFAPAFANQPASQTVGLGSVVTFTALVSGVPTPALQWRREGANLPGATSATLALTSAQLADAGTYQLVASNSLGSASSAAVTLTVNAGPVFTTQPAGRSVAVGASVTLAAAASGSPAPVFQWRKDGGALPGATLATLTFAAVQTADAASYTVVATNSTGTTVSEAAVLTVIAVPQIVASPAAQAIAPGAGASFAVGVAGTGPFAFQWLKDGVEVAGATAATFALAAAQPGDAGLYAVRVRNAAGTVTSAAAALVVAVPNPGRIVNLSILTTITAAQPAFTVGTVIGGGNSAGAKPLLVRAVGPSLEPLGVAGALADPRLELFAGPALIAGNDDWGSPASGAAALGSAFAGVGAFPLASATSRDAAIFAPTLAPGAYSVRVSGVDGAAGLVLAELYDAGDSRAPGGPRLVNVSVLQPIATGGGLTAGFVIGGATPVTVLVRAIGPALRAFGVSDPLADPRLELFAGAVRLDGNDDWGSPAAGTAALAASFARVGAFVLAETSGKDAALLVTLAPGAYTVQASGGTGLGGIVLVELYEVP